MGDQPLFKSNHTVNNADSLYYQQQSSPLTTMSGGMNHSYASASMDASQSSPVSPHFPPDTREAAVAGALPVKSHGNMIEPSRPTSWPHSSTGNHVQIRNDLASANTMWTSSAQTDDTDGYLYVYSQANDNPSQKMTSGVLHKLDSFTQVFASQNLRIPQSSNISQTLPSQASIAESMHDSALRQLLSQKPPAEQQPVVHQIQRFQQSLPQQMHRAFPVAQHKQQIQMYFDYQQMLQSQSVLQHGQTHVQQLQAQQVLSQQLQQLPQQQYFMHQQQLSQQHTSAQEMQQQQQQQQRHMHPAHYYQSQQALCQLQQPMQQPMLPPPPYHREQNRKVLPQTHQYSRQDPPSHHPQHIQMAAPSQYFYEDQSHYRHMYQQNALHQQQEEAVQQTQFHAESRIQASVGSHTSTSSSEGAEENSRKELSKMAHPGAVKVPQRHLVTPPNIPHAPVKVSPQQSPNHIWSQVNLLNGPYIGQGRGAFQERADVKSRLTCTICHKEFKSLPALNGHMRSHGGQKASPKQTFLFDRAFGHLPPPPPEKQPKEVDHLMPIIMPVSVPVKLLPAEPSKQVTTAKDKPANSVSDDEMPVLTKMTDSPPHSPKVARPCSSSEIIRKCQPTGVQSEDGLKSQQEKKKYRHRPEPLFIPPPSFNLAASYPGATLYQSQLRSPRIMGDHLLDRTQELPPYTPPPMLSPVRQGSGLFSSVISSSHSGTYQVLPITPLTPTPRVLFGRASNIDASIITSGPGEQTVDIEPRINMGPRFQAAIPVLRDRSLVTKDISKADLVWKPWRQLENLEVEQRVEDLLNMACSSVLPGGGTNRELALHCLSEANGNILMALEILLMKKIIRPKSHSLTDYHYAGSDKWTVTERKLFNKALIAHTKDFFLVQKMVKSKTVAQCVEYYYTWKKILRLGRKHRTRLAETEAEGMVNNEELEDEEDDERKSEKEGESTGVQTPPVQLQTSLVEQPLVIQGPTFMCEMPNCGAIFSSRQALNGHARIHGGSNQIPKQTPAVKLKVAAPQPSYASVKSSPAHSTTSGETDAPKLFPCKECGKMFYKVKSRNAHMKTHRQQEDHQRQKVQKATPAPDLAAAVRSLPTLLHQDHMSMVKQEMVMEEEEEEVAQELVDVMDTDLLLDEEDNDLLPDDDEL
uniref:Transcriptional regulating factor 1 n=1 Tax=Callorhinchus milii TaxID=7868 RepID=A0A4W3H3U3_CALMI